MKQKGLLCLTFIVFYFLIESITFRWVDFSFLPQAFLVDVLFVLGVASVTLLFRSHKIAIIYMTIVLAWIMALFLVNATMYSVYFELFTLQQLTLIGEATNVFNFEFLSIPSIAFATVISILYFTWVIILWRKFNRNKVFINGYYKKTFSILAVIFMLIFLVFSTNLRTIKRYNSAVYITTFKRSSLEEYGLLAYYWKEAETIVLGNVINNYSEIGEDIIPVKDSIPTEYFGLLKDANIITVLVESLQPFAVNETLTPNLYKMTQDGIYFSNNYSENKTNFSEMIAMTGNYPTFPLLVNSYEYDFSYSLPSILNNGNNYNTAYFHDNVGSFYSRDKFMDDLGFDNSYFHYDLFPDEKLWTWNGDYTLDSLTVEKMIDNMDFTSEPFYYYWATMVMHGPYNYGSGNKALFEELGYFEAIDQAVADGVWVNPLENGEEVDRLRLRHYEAAVMDFDKALGILIEELELAGKLDDTIIVLFGDHSVYYHELQLKIHDADSSEYYNMDLYKTFLSIYNPILTEEYLKTNETTAITSFTSPLNIVPTLFDLLGIINNQNMMLAESVFSGEQQVFYSNKLTSFFDDNLYSNDGYEIIYNKEDVNQAYIDAFLAICEKQRNRLEIVNYWYDKTKDSQ